MQTRSPLLVPGVAQGCRLWDADKPTCVFDLCLLRILPLQSSEATGKATGPLFSAVAMPSMLQAPRRVCRLPSALITAQERRRACMPCACTSPAVRHSYHKQCKKLAAHARHARIRTACASGSLCKAWLTCQALRASFVWGPQQARGLDAKQSGILTIALAGGTQ